MGGVREKSRLFDEPAWNCRWMRTLLCRIVRIVSIRVVTANLSQLNGVLHVDAVCMTHSVWIVLYRYLWNNIGYSLLHSSRTNIIPQPGS